ncbi:MAG: hypothetical protein ISS52_05595 [Dehalococcoidia bacterium]|nr:hypothetical protein [Dehalococcoidia bacterium]
MDEEHGHQQGGKAFSNEAVYAYVEWLKSHIPMVSAYHNHKETMAWLATALYLPTIIGLGHLISLEKADMVLQVVFTLALLLAAALFLVLFINMQFTERWTAADRIKGLMKTMVMLLAEKALLTSEDRREIEVKGAVWPRFVAIRLDECLTPRCWKQTLCFLFSFRWYKLDPRWKTELASYFMIIISTVIAGLLIWT